MSTFDKWLFTQSIMFPFIWFPRLWLPLLSSQMSRVVSWEKWLNRKQKTESFFFKKTHSDKPPSAPRCLLLMSVTYSSSPGCACVPACVLGGCAVCFVSSPFAAVCQFALPFPELSWASSYGAKPASPAPLLTGLSPPPVPPVPPVPLCPCVCPLAQVGFWGDGEWGGGGAGQGEVVEQVHRGSASVCRAAVYQCPGAVCTSVRPPVRTAAPAGAALLPPALLTAPSRALPESGRIRESSRQAQIRVLLPSDQTSGGDHIFSLNYQLGHHCDQFRGIWGWKLSEGRCFGTGQTRS